MYYSGYFVDEGPYLMHYGVLGMKWGVRRYRNADGTYTAAGRKRHAEAQARYEGASSSYKAAKSQLKAAKKEKKSSFRDKVKSRIKLHYDKEADKGRRLKERKKSIVKNVIKGTAAHVAGNYAKRGARYLLQGRYMKVGENGYIPLSEIARKGINVANYLYDTHLSNQNKQMATYYAYQAREKRKNKSK